MKLKNESGMQKKDIIYAKNVLKLKNKKKKDILKQKKINEKIVKKCNSKILTKTNDYRDIYLQIDKFNNNGKKTIVYFLDNFYPCVDGVLMVVENYVTQMSKFYNVVVCAPNHKNKNVTYDKYFVLFADSVYLKGQGYDLAFPQLDARFQKFISLLKIDLIHLHSPFNMGTFGLNLAKKRNIPCFATFHSQYKRDFYEAVKNETLANMLTKVILYIYEKSTLCLTMNEFSKSLMKEYGLENKISIVSNATNLKKKEFEAAQEKFVLGKYGINNEKFNMLYIGRLVTVKNVYFILKTLKELYKINKQFKFIFMGDGPEMEKMKDFCKDNGILENVIFTGKVLNEDEKAIIIKNSSLLFFPSEYDTDGIVKMECACYSVPSLCIEGTGAASNIIDNQNGFLAKNDTKTCAEIINFLSKNVKILQKTGKNANLEIYKSWEDVALQLHKLYEFYFNKNY